MSENNNDKAIRALPCWTGEVEISSLSGGITERSIARGFTAMQCASLLREALWGIDFDYASYARDYLQRLEGRWQDFQGSRG